MRGRLNRTLKRENVKRQNKVDDISIIIMEKNDGSFMCSSVSLVLTAILCRICIFNIYETLSLWKLLPWMPNSSSVLSVFIVISWRISGDVSRGLYLILSLAKAHVCILFYLGEEYNNLGFIKERRGYYLLQWDALRGTLMLHSRYISSFLYVSGKPQWTICTVFLICVFGRRQKILCK